jgi:hypothetical protein
MSTATLLAETADLNRASLSRAAEVDFATAGTRLGEIVVRDLDKNRGSYNRLRAAVMNRLHDLGEAGEKTGLFLLAADMAMTAELEGTKLSSSDRLSLRQLWDHLRLG